jgi:hypothetical protein
VVDSADLVAAVAAVAAPAAAGKYIIKTFFIKACFTGLYYFQ